MIKVMKQRDGSYRVVFGLADGVVAEHASVVGDFNDWDPSCHPMKPGKNRRLEATVQLGPGHYQFRYLVDDGQWHDDDGVGRCPNPFGGENGLLQLE
jgi:1,4-alpha-glucan branching enzyme